MRRLPPLNALRAFESAARHTSFNQAADELNVTPSAISHQIRALEDHFGLRLFRRVKRQVVLTAEAREFLPALTDALDQIDAASQRLMRRPQGTLLDISVAPTFAMGWLVPRISEFQADHPEIEIRMTTQVAFTDFVNTTVDLAIAYGHGEWEGLSSIRLMEEHLVPVCSPKLLAPTGPLADIQDISRVTLLHALPRIGQWRHWMRVAGVTGVDPEKGPKFQTTPLTLEAAIAGLGIAIGNPDLVARHLDNRDLVVPFDVEMPSESGYHLVMPREHEHDPKILTFSNWLFGKIREGANQSTPIIN